MKKSFTAFVAAAMLATVPLAISTESASAAKWWEKAIVGGVAAGATAAIVNNAITRNQQQRTVVVQQAPQVIYTQPSYSQAHYAWCQGRWASYDIGSNSYQPFNAPRRQCISPYN